mgnify:CR=1 FL=1
MTLLLSQLYSMFGAVDESGDGRLSFDEFVRAQPLLARWGTTVADPRTTFDAIDSDGAGMVLFDEFSRWAISQQLDLPDDDDDPPESPKPATAKPAAAKRGKSPRGACQGSPRPGGGGGSGGDSPRRRRVLSPRSGSAAGRGSGGGCDAGGSGDGGDFKMDGALYAALCARFDANLKAKGVPDQMMS